MRKTAIMDKKAQGLSLNTIIIAIIVMIVLVVIIMVFTGYFGAKFTPGMTNCENNGGKCVFASEDEGCGYDSFGSKLATISGTCPSKEQICCSKGLGTGSAPEDFSKCGEEGQNPCPGNICNTAKGLNLIGGKCKAPVSCTVSDWNCGAWTACVDGEKTRTCTLKNADCKNPDTVKPAESEDC